MDLILNDWKHLLGTETSQKSILKTFYYNNKGLRKVKTLKNSLIKKFTFPFNLLVLNITNLSNSFHGQTSLKDAIFLFLKSGVKILLIGLKNALVVIYFRNLKYIECTTDQIVCTQI